MNKEAIKLFDNQYFPSVNWFKNSINETNIKIIGFEKYQKRSFFNRCAITGANGLIFLSVPVEGGRNKNQKMLFRDVKISYADNWQKQHWKTIESCYNNSPFFQFYSPYLERFFTKKFDFLFDFNLEIIQTISKLIFDNKAVVVVSDDFLEEDSVVEKIAFYPADFQNFVAPKYYQLFEDKLGFLPNLSILDLLFMEGNNSVNILKQTD